MTTTLVFLHGRGQEFKDPAALTTTWLTGLAAGLAGTGLPAPAADRVAFPYYGNVLYQIAARLAQSRTPVDLESLATDVDAPGPLHPELPPDVGQAERRIIAGMAVAAGLNGGPAGGLDAGRVDEEGLADGLGTRVLSWRVARQVLIQVARRTDVDQAIIKEHIRDVAVYLTRGRDEVLATVRAGVPADGPLVLVTHSLGTVVGRDLLDDEDVRRRTRLWVTAGSPLGLDAVQRNLRTPGRQHPAGVAWLSAYDVHDVVALGHPLRPAFGDPLDDLAVDNRDRPHAIERYLAHPQVARPIGTAASQD